MKLCTYNLQMSLVKSYQKNFDTPKNALLIAKQSFLLARKTTLFHILVKVNAVNFKLKSLVQEVIQRLCAKYGANQSTGGVINPQISSFLKDDRIHT